MVVELECIGKLCCDLVYTVNKLKKYWRSVRVRMVIITVTNTLKNEKDNHHYWHTILKSDIQ